MKLIQRYPALRKASFKNLQAFESAYMHKSFTAAAAELNVTASAISHSILTLESVLGVHLFDRGKKGAIPTDEGAQLYFALKRSFAEIDIEMQSIIDRPSRHQLVTLHSSPSFAHLWFLPRIPDLIRLHPEIDLRLRAVHETPDFSNNDLDLAIVYGRKPTSSLIVSEPAMASESYVPICSPALAKRNSLEPQQIAQLHLIHVETSIVQWSDWINAYFPEHEGIQRGLYLDRSFMSFSAAVNCLGVCLDSTLLAYDYLKERKLVMPFGKKGIAACAHHLCVPKPKIEQAKIQKTLQWIKSWLPE
ncbi:MAG: LysR family transcriptional regulator [Candidatus Accumulibacter sp.]|jgi:LysR family glycine cleavage system transcriptional activator|nr:LysR family transcriptional regulator [Accumulibacter sp.]